MSEPARALSEPSEIDLDGIMARIPHRYPFLLIDRLVDVRLGESAIGIKNVTANEPYFQGHFPGRPVMPGVLIIEAMAQTAGVHVAATLGHDSAPKNVYFMTIESARFRAPVVPGDQLRLEVRHIRSRLSVFKYDGRAMVDDRLVAEATISAMLMSD